MQGIKLTMEEMKYRASKPKPASKNRKEYIQWWMARNALGMEVKTKGKSQNQLMMERKGQHGK
jgi:hypothetical protein